MKKFLAILSFAILMVSSISCEKLENDFPPYFKVAIEGNISGSTSNPADFSKILDVVNPYVNTDLKSEKEAVNLYNQLLSQTKDAPYSVGYDSSITLLIRKYVAKKESESVISYDIDKTYTSPVAHIWDKSGSRDLK